MDLEAVAVRLVRSKSRPDLQGCYGVVERQVFPTFYELCFAQDTVVVRQDDFTFVGDDLPPLEVGRVASPTHLVLDASLRGKLLGNSESK